MHFELLYKATQDGFGAQEFHKRCDYKGATLVLAHTKNGYKFGGYTPVSWESPRIFEYKSDEKKESFIFSITHRTRHMLKDGAGAAIENYINDGPTFGGGYDFIIENNPDTRESNSDFGHSYTLPEHIEYNSQQAKMYLAGAYTFLIQDYEVYSLVKAKSLMFK